MDDTKAREIDTDIFGNVSDNRLIVRKTDGAVFQQSDLKKIESIKDGNKFALKEDIVLIDENAKSGQIADAKAVYDKTKNMCTTTVADVPTTKININASYISDANCYYEVKNGICYVNFVSGTYVVSSQLDGVTLATGLPKPSAPQVPHTYVLWAGLPSQQVILFVKNDGRLVLHAAQVCNGGCIYTTFSYPVSES